MSCDITTFCEVKNKETGRWELSKPVFPAPHWRDDKSPTSEPFNWQDYTMFGFLADVRNYDEIPVIKPADHILPKPLSEEVFVQHLSEEDYGIHSKSSLTLKELLAFDYNKKFINKRYGTDDYEKELTVREALRDNFFRDLEILKTLGKPEDVRIVFWFDN